MNYQNHSGKIEEYLNSNNLQIYRLQNIYFKKENLLEFVFDENVDLLRDLNNLEKFNSTNYKLLDELFEGVMKKM